MPPTIRQAYVLPELIGKQNNGLSTSSWVVVNSPTGNSKRKFCISSVAKGSIMLYGLAHLNTLHPHIGDAKNPKEVESHAD